jgi:predicted amidohydrolase
MKNTVRVASVQFEHAPGDKQANLLKIRRFVEKAAEQNVEMIVFPECCITGYWFMKDLSKEEMVALAEPAFEGPSWKFLMSLSKKYDMTIGAGLIEITGEQKLFKDYAVAMPNGEFKCHRKIHAFVNQHLMCGSEYTVFDTPHGCKIGVLICYDNNIIENVRITALKGAQILFAPHQTGGCRSNDPNIMGVIDRSLWDNRYKNPTAIEGEFRGPKGRDWLMRWLPSRAHDNGLFLVFSNGVGVDGDEIRTGNSMIIDPYGRILTETWKADDDMVIADLDLKLVDNSTGRRWIRTRKPELYNPLTVPTGMEKSTRELRFDKMGI